MYVCDSSVSDWSLASWWVAFLAQVAQTLNAHIIMVAEAEGQDEFGSKNRW